MGGVWSATRSIIATGSGTVWQILITIDRIYEQYSYVGTDTGQNP